jgi:hypothetical protein
VNAEDVLEEMDEALEIARASARAEGPRGLFYDGHNDSMKDPEYRAAWFEATIELWLTEFLLVAATRLYNETNASQKEVKAAVAKYIPEDTSATPFFDGGKWMWAEELD